MAEKEPKLVLDKLGKEWSCQLEVDNGTLIVHIEGYTKQYPLILAQDNIFVKNVNNTLFWSNRYRYDAEDEINILKKKIS